MSDEATPAAPMILCENLVKIYKVADLEVVALQGLDLAVDRGEVMAIIGNSGSGKSTLLNIIGGLDRPSAGRISVDGKDLLKLGDADLVDYRRDTVGFVWQSNARNLVPWLTARENVELPMLVGHRPARTSRARELLELVGLANRTESRLVQLSGGEQQRVAIAIGLANSPKVLLADEPTGEVDSVIAMRLLDVFHEARDAFGVTVIIVTHDRRLSGRVDRVVAIRDGRTSSEFVRRVSYREEMDGIEAGMGGPAHEEMVIVDRAGRLALPREYLDELGITGRAKVDLENGRIVITPPPKDG
jgi:ABC-type lipoprotein export system ATPase subunit